MFGGPRMIFCHRPPILEWHPWEWAMLCVFTWPYLCRSLTWGAVQTERSRWGEQWHKAQPQCVCTARNQTAYVDLHGPVPWSPFLLGQPRGCEHGVSVSKHSYSFNQPDLAHSRKINFTEFRLKAISHTNVASFTQAERVSFIHYFTL